MLEFNIKKYLPIILIGLLLIVAIPVLVNAQSTIGQTAEALNQEYNKPLSELLANNTALETSWKFCLALVDIVAIFGLIFIAFANILNINIEAFDIKKLLPSLIVGVILAHFSFFVCREILEISEQIEIAILPNIKAVGMGALYFEMGKNIFVGGIAGIAALIMGGAMLANPITAGLGCLTILLGGPMFWISGLSTLAVALILFVRQFIIWGLCIVSPLAVVFYFMPFGKGVAEKWFSWFFKWVFMGPIIILIVRFMSEINSWSNIITNQGWKDLTMWIALTFLPLLTIYAAFMLSGGVLSNIWGRVMQGANMAWKAGNWALNTKYGRAGQTWLGEQAESMPGRLGELVKQGKKFSAGVEGYTLMGESKKEERTKQATGYHADRELTRTITSTFENNAERIKNAEKAGDVDALRYKSVINQDAENNAVNMTPESLATMLKSYEKRQELVQIVHEGGSGAFNAADALYKHDGALAGLLMQVNDPGRYGPQSEKAIEILNQMGGVYGPTDNGGVGDLTAQFYPPPDSVAARVPEETVAASFLGNANNLDTNRLETIISDAHRGRLAETSKDYLVSLGATRPQNPGEATHTARQALETSKAIQSLGRDKTKGGLQAVADEIGNLRGIDNSIDRLSADLRTQLRNGGVIDVPVVQQILTTQLQGLPRQHQEIKQTAQDSIRSVLQNATGQTPTPNAIGTILDQISNSLQGQQNINNLHSLIKETIQNELGNNP